MSETPPANHEFFHHGRGGPMFDADYCDVTFVDGLVSKVVLVAD
jgi:hypothetical protein